MEFIPPLSELEAGGLLVKLEKYDNFEELYKHHNKPSLGYFDYEEAKPSDMNLYYPQERIDHYGVLGIEIRKI